MGAASAGRDLGDAASRAYGAVTSSCAGSIANAIPPRPTPHKSEAMILSACPPYVERNRAAARGA
jgi:hypothetical protein